MTRSSALGTAIFAAVVLSGACTPLSGPRTGPEPRAETLSPARQAVVAANAELVRLLADARADAAWALFTDEGALMAPGQRLVAGEDALREYVGGGGYELAGVRLAGVEVETCRDHALVRGTLSRPSTGGAGPGSWRYAAIWRREGGLWRATMAVLDGPEMERRSLGRGCAPAVEVNRHLILSAYVFPFVRRMGGPGSSLESAMADHGWNTASGGKACGAVACVGGDHPRHDREAGDFILSLRSRLRPPLGVEAVFSHTPTHTVEGLKRVPPECDGCSPHRLQVAASMETDLLGAALFYEYFNFRVGVGPAISRTQWMWSHLTTAEEPWTTTDLGLMAVTGGSFPIGSRIIAEVHGQLRVQGEADVPAFRDFPATRVSQTGFSLSLGLGVGF
jgi:hypothetical protein